ncbi:MAG: hypothetical protein ACLRTQ_08860 [Candidatus Borkfalkia sp.]
MSFDILGTGSRVPRKVVTNDDLTEFLDTSDEWIYTRTGIRKRHVLTDETLLDLAVGSAETGLEDAKLLPRRSGSCWRRPCAETPSRPRSRSAWRKNSASPRPRST